MASGKSSQAQQFWRSQFRGDLSKRMRQDSGEEDSESVCQKCDNIVSDKIMCTGCKLYYCLKCASVSRSLYACIKNGELENFHWTCPCCKSMFPSLDNIASVLQDIQSKQDARLSGLEDRMTRIEQKAQGEIKSSVSNMKEEILESVKQGIDIMVDTRNKELEERKRREFNLAVFNLPEHNNEVGNMNKLADESDFKEICSGLGLETVNIVTTFRLGKKNRNVVRPLKVILSDKSHRKFLLDNAKHIPRKLPTRLQRVVITKDLTLVQRQERKERFELKKAQQLAIQTEQEKIEEENLEIPNQPKSPVAMELDARAPSPIPQELQAMSQLNNMRDSQGDISQSHFDQSTILNDTTIIGGFTVEERDFLNDPGSPV